MLLTHARLLAPLIAAPQDCDDGDDGGSNNNPSGEITWFIGGRGGVARPSGSGSPG